MLEKYSQELPQSLSLGGCFSLQFAYLAGYSSEMLKDEKTMFVCSQPNNALLFVKGRKQNEN
jgi:hypothetical protein